MIQQELKPIHQRLDIFETKFDTLESRFDNLETRFDTLEGQQQENSGYIKALLHRSEELDAKLKTYCNAK